MRNIQTVLFLLFYVSALLICCLLINNTACIIFIVPGLIPGTPALGCWFHDWNLLRRQKKGLDMDKKTQSVFYEKNFDTRRIMGNDMF